MDTQQKRATIYLEASLHKALRVKAAETDRTISEIVSRAVRRELAEDSEDLAAFRARAGPVLSGSRVFGGWAIHLEFSHPQAIPRKAWQDFESVRGSLLQGAFAVLRRGEYNNSE